MTALGARLNPGAKTGRAIGTNSRLILAICPAVIFICGAILMWSMMPIYSGLRALDYDPGYPYLFNGVAIMNGLVPGHIDHPGTPVQMAIGLITSIAWFVAKSGGLTNLSYTQSVIANPEHYLLVVMSVFLLLNSIAIFYVGQVIMKSTEQLLAGVACQSMYFVMGDLLPRLFHAAPESLLFLSAATLMCLLVPSLFRDDGVSAKRAIAIGFAIALGMTSKITFAPLILLVFLLRRPWPILIALLATVISGAILLYPIHRQLLHVYDWFVTLATHDGSYGTGHATIVDVDALPWRFQHMSMKEPVLLFAGALVLATTWINRSRGAWKGYLLTAVIAIQLLLTAKHFAIHYLMPSVAISPVCVVWAMSRLAVRENKFAVMTALSIGLGALQFVTLESSFAKERAENNANVAAVSELIARYPNPLVIGSYRSHRLSYALQFGSQYVDKAFAAQMAAGPAGDNLIYWAGRILHPTGGDIDPSYLDQIAKSGRAILIVRSRTILVDQNAFKTEAVFDQGFGDVVERYVPR